MEMDYELLQILLEVMPLELPVVLRRVPLP
jgi:hypothetical protein